MKKLVILAIMAVSILVSCAKKEKVEVFQLFVSISDFEGKQVKVQRRVNDIWVAIDSTLVKDGLAKLSGKMTSPEMLFLSLQDVKGSVPFFAEPVEITIKLSSSNIREAEIAGSLSHKRYLDFMDEYENFDEVLYQYYQAYQAAAETNSDSAKLKAEEDYSRIEKEKKQFLIDYAMKNNTDIVAQYLIFRNSHQFDLEELEGIVVNFDPDNGSTYLEILRDRVLVLKSVAIGMPFIDFEQAAPNDSLIKLSSKVGAKLLLVDFWASWCQPCRAENPAIVAVYKEFKDKGFDVFGVSFDTNKDMWLEAIAADQLTWTQVSDLKGWGNAAGKQYGVQSIPHSVLLDRNGTIIAKNLRGAELKAKVAEMLK